MSADVTHSGGVWKSYYGPNLGYIQEQYERYAVDPASVDAHYRDLFARYGAPPGTSGTTAGTATTVEPSLITDVQRLQQAVSAVRIAESIRAYGHLAADLDPLGVNAQADTRRFEPETFGLTADELRSLPASLVWEEAPDEIESAWDAVQRLRELYTQSIAFEFSHVHDLGERLWLRQKVSSGLVPPPMTDEARSALLKRLIEVEQFETFLHRTFVGQKRFSIEGTDVLVPMLDEIVQVFARGGAAHILMGMAHRGRLNVLAHVLGKPYGSIFSEFHHSPNKDLFPSEGSMGINYGWTGDVKYHLGADRALEDGDRIRTTITLANNPSHLEFVNPVVEGFTRAAQDDRSQPGYPEQNAGRAAAVLIHGDAAFPGEGIVSETLNFNKLRGYQNGGTVHIIVNNRIGFTTDSHDSRSTLYASDLAKGFEIPIVHVNADDPEACLAAIRMAAEYREQFKKDFLIDLIGYRRHGHNEMDDPSATQSLVYEKVSKHPTVATRYAETLRRKGLLDDSRIEAMKRQVDETLQQAYDRMKALTDRPYHYHSDSFPRSDAAPSKMTAVPLERLQDINRQLLEVPEGFHVYPKLERILQRRVDALNDDGAVDWALAEALAFATILEDGQPIRLSGQDSERGTFAHRHLVLHDYKTGNTFCPLHRLPQAKASFGVYNSPLSEASVLGFEYGYNVFAPETLVLWEAQFGDFANAAQVIFDQFISAGLAKWHQYSNLVMLLPHGYEGQGPEHSSARLERYLQSCAERNWTVANLSSAAQYFHLLRRQAASGRTTEARPLVLMTPKSLLRNARSAAPASSLTEGSFRPILEEPLLGGKPKKTERLILCSGKVTLDLQAGIEAEPERKWDWLHIVRIEQLYPFPDEDITAVLQRLPALKEIVWVQEEPKNMGAWTYMEPRLRELTSGNIPVRYIGRAERSSTASGYADVHNIEQRNLIANALKLIDTL
ncbi:2-oxoglutarate dehydrogenase E1 component [Paenibacillus profundus]|uniref:2-oxoglutarate dehydrogenase E1 component n=1 Tax=Paenibacillus profundus TaxID=1173085 RepID=A0ABS8YLV5_9BACL|nr:2-oxoglutarate dehydrogenase E1 component [Paenibacillus profundus]MCE5171306.1 2-oxoglutarate dehydrogenase E1 component [Paenibacillus profundus]